MLTCKGRSNKARAHKEMGKNALGAWLCVPQAPENNLNGLP